MRGRKGEEEAERKEEEKGRGGGGEGGKQRCLEKEDHSPTPTPTLPLAYPYPTLPCPALPSLPYPNLFGALAPHSVPPWCVSAKVFPGCASAVPWRPLGACQQKRTILGRGGGRASLNPSRGGSGQGGSSGV